jgi:superfamily II RNA helicase
LEEADQNIKLGRPEGFLDGYYYKYAHIECCDVTAVFKSQCKFTPGSEVHLTREQRLSPRMLKSLMKHFKGWQRDSHAPQGYTNKKDTAALLKTQQELLEQLCQNQCYDSEQLLYSLTKRQLHTQLRIELADCTALLDSESNEKEDDFEAKNKVLQNYQFIDENQNMLFKGKVARVVTSSDPILLTQLVFSGKLKDLSDEEMLAILSVLLDRTKASKGHEMFSSRISDNFWGTCIWLESEATKLIELEKQFGVTGEIDDVSKRLNYYFYEIVYDWAKKKSFFAIKDANPMLEEGVIIKAIQNITQLLKVVKEMSELIGDV